MNITGGRYNSRIIKTPDFVNVKPTLSKIRQAVFNSLSSAGEFSTFLDLFSGSGIMAFEAVSRGFVTTAVEKDKKTADFIRQNIKTLNCDIDLYNTDALKFLNITDKIFDVIYIDPPYLNIELYVKSLGLIKNKGVLSDGGVVILEKPSFSEINFAGYTIFREKKYSDKTIIFLTK